MMPRHYRKSSEPITQEWLLSILEKKRNGCWVWSRSCNTFGYGQVWNGNRLVVVHRVAYELFVGEIPAGLKVLHKCDNPPCANPDHLFIGTQSDNLYDMSRKGRYVGNRRLTEEDVHEIRTDNRTQVEIGADYGVTQSNVSRIKSRDSWRKVK